MREYVLLLPILFIFHDMEEIIGFGRFFQKNPDIFERFPRVTAPYRNYSTAGMALAVYEEFIPFFGVSLLAYYYPGEVLNALWYGLMVSLTAHFLIHIGQSVYIRKYIPSLITSIICLPVSLVIIVKCMDFIEFDFPAMLCIIVGIIGMIVNLKFAHMLMHWYVKRD